ncbi:helix-turn-helix domain-containing protein [Spirosoma koreense]
MMDPSCHTAPTISEEQFIAQHFFTYLEAGSLQVYDGSLTYHIHAGDCYLATRNHLAKYQKQSYQGRFKTTTVFFSEDLLKSLSEEQGYQADVHRQKSALIQIQPHPPLLRFINDLLEEQVMDKPEGEQDQVATKKALVILLVELDPSLSHVLFDFKPPGKIDLEAFMNRYYRFNVSLARFGYLTGRSLSAFKRDFTRIFGLAPGRWLLAKRLEEAYFLLTKTDRSVSDVCFAIGFEDVSHFSFSFKARYQLTPTRLRKVLTKDIK